MSNCAMCAMAGILDLTTADIERLVGAHGQSDDALQKAWNLEHLEAEQLFIAATDQLYRFVETQLTNAGTLRASARSGVGYASFKDSVALNQWMLTFPEGTKFAVWGSNAFIGENAHWNCAERRGRRGVEFIDYQYEHDAQAPRTGPHFLSPEGDDVEDDEYKKFYGLAFTLVRRRSACVIL